MCKNFKVGQAENLCHITVTLHSHSHSHREQINNLQCCHLAVSENKRTTDLIIDWIEHLDLLKIKPPSGVHSQ